MKTDIPPNERKIDILTTVIEDCKIIFSVSDKTYKQK